MDNLQPLGNRVSDTIMKSFFLRSLPLRVLPLTIALFVAPRVQAQLQFGNALSFNGVNQYVTVPNFGAIIPTNEVTVEFWADTAQFGTQSAFMLNPDNNANRFNVHLNYNSPSPGVTYWDFGNISSGGRLGPVSAPANSIGNWVHYAFVASQSGNFMRIYTNGVLQASQSGMSIFARGSYSLQIGGPGFPYNGSLDEFRVWSVARTQAQIQGSRYTPLTGYEAGLVVYYKFDSASGTVATNSAAATGAAYNGTLVNSPSWAGSTIPIPVNPVTSPADSGPGSLRNAVTSLAAGSTITFAAGLSGQPIVLTNGQIVLSNNVTIDASALASGIEISGNGSSRIFQVNAGATVTLNSLIITNAYSNDGNGGGIYNRGILTVTNCIVVNNIDARGNGGNGQDGSDGYAGGIYNSGTLTVNNSVLAHNTGRGGGGGNGANGGSARGGGIYNDTGATATMNNSTLTNNNSSAGTGGNGGDGGSAYGGGIYNSGMLTISNCTLANNSVDGGSGFFASGAGSGGGIYNNSGATLTVNNSTVANNSGNGGPDGDAGSGGGAYGGGLYSAGTLTVNNSTLAGNNVTGGGGQTFDNGGDGEGSGIYNSGTLTMRNSTLANNRAVAGNGGLDASPGTSAGGGIYNTLTLRLTNSIVCSNLSASASNISGTTTSGANNLVDADALLAPLGNYGGPTQTMPPEPASPAINAGAPTTLTTDQRGLPRNVGAPDIGAVELQSGQAYPVVLNTNDSGPGSLRQTLLNAPGSSTVTFDPALSGQTIILTNGQIILKTNVFIEGPADGIYISGNGASRVFQVNSGTAAILALLTITNGNAGSGNFGGAIYVTGGAEVELIACTLAGNSSSQGGAIENEGSLTMESCTLAGNHTSTAPGVGGNGGAIDNNQGPLSLIQCTLANNTAAGNGGGIANFQNTVSLTNCIVAANTGGGGDLYNFSASTIAAGGTNLVQSYFNGGTLNGSGSFVARAPLLAALGDYGGPTPTMPPLPGSPAIDGGSTAAFATLGLNSDQRGYACPSGARVDIGAVEVQIAAAPFPITEFTRQTNGVVQFILPSLVGGSFTVFATTNVALPFNTWSNLGPVLETPPGSGVFQFTDPQAKNFARRFYRVSSP